MPVWRWRFVCHARKRTGNGVMTPGETSRWRATSSSSNRDWHLVPLVREDLLGNANFAVIIACPFGVGVGVVGAGGSKTWGCTMLGGGWKLTISDQLSGGDLSRPLALVKYVIKPAMRSSKSGSRVAPDLFPCYLFCIPGVLLVPPFVPFPPLC